MSGLASILAGPAVEIIDKVIPDAQASRETQADLAMNDSKNPSLFVSGWRPFIGWAFGAIFLWNFIVAPFLVWVSALLGSTVPNVPSIPLDALLPVLIGMLGLGGLRTFEKVRGATR